MKNDPTAKRRMSHHSRPIASSARPTQAVMIVAPPSHKNVWTAPATRKTAAINPKTPGSHFFTRPVLAKSDEKRVNDRSESARHRHPHP